MPTEPFNIASTLKETAACRPDQRAIVWRSRRGAFEHVTFRQLDEESDALACGLISMGVAPGARLALMTRPGREFIALTFAIFKAGAVVVLIDPGMGARRMFGCLDQVAPDGFIGLPVVQALRILSGRRFRQARFNVTVGRPWFWGGVTYVQLRESPHVPGVDRGANAPRSPVVPPLLEGGPGVARNELASPIVATRSSDPAAIIFTSGSTGPAKGVVYEHGMFAAQVAALRDYYQLEPGGIDLSAFPLFGLFNAALEVTTVVPEMNPAHPARVDPARIVAAIEAQGVTQAFGSPAIWKRVGEFCEQRELTLPTVRRIFLAGAPVAADILRTMKRALADEKADLYTPYGATEALPVCSISASEVLARTAQKTREGAGTCVGRPFPRVQLKIIEMTDTPLPDLAAARELPRWEIGEIIVRGEMVTREYFRQPEATGRAKIRDGDGFWHRMGDVGYLDETDALWFCGRKAHAVETDHGRLCTECVEPIFNAHPRVARTALVGVGARPRQMPVIVVEPEPWYRPTKAEIDGVLLPELREVARGYSHTALIERFLVYPRSLPVDVRHNIKVNRERLSAWASGKLGHQS
ncbi:MAG: fatty acid CoA ligase family protein [Planctomycetaceae bacterium]